VDHRGGLDGFLLKAKDSELSEKALKVKRDVRRAVQSDAQAPAPTEAA
jgi:large subunit ribosomal protein L28